MTSPITIYINVGMEHQGALYKDLLHRSVWYPSKLAADIDARATRAGVLKVDLGFTFLKDIEENEDGV